MSTPEQETSSETTTNSDEMSLENFVQAFSPDDEAPADESPPEEKPKPKDLKSLAETLGMEVKDLYDLQVPSSRDGEDPYTIGKLKDLAGEHDEFTLRSLKWEEQRSAKEKEIARAQAELRELMAALPEGAIKPEVLEKARAKHQAHVKAERARTLEAIPEWQDEDLRETELEGIAEHLKGYGFPDSYLASIHDHRTLKYIRENWQREQRIAKALAAVSERKTKTPPKSGPVTKTRRQPVSAGSEEAKAAAFLSALQ